MASKLKPTPHTLHTSATSKYSQFIWPLAASKQDAIKFPGRVVLWNVNSAWCTGRYATKQEAEEAFELATLVLGNNDMTKFITPGYVSESDEGEPEFEGGGASCGGSGRGSGGEGGGGGGGGRSEAQKTFEREAATVLATALQSKLIDLATFDKIYNATLKRRDGQK